MLVRQQLRERRAGAVSDLVDRLVGLQAQAPLAPYVALWSRLADFVPEALSELMTAGSYVRGHGMRSTIHLLSAADFPPLRALSDSAVALNLSSRERWAQLLAEADRPALAADLRAALADGPLPREALAGRLIDRWGGMRRRRPRRALRC